MADEDSTEAEAEETTEERMLALGLAVTLGTSELTTEPLAEAETPLEVGRAREDVTEGNDTEGTKEEDGIPEETAVPVGQTETVTVLTAPDEAEAVGMPVTVVARPVLVALGKEETEADGMPVVRLTEGTRVEAVAKPEALTELERTLEVALPPMAEDEAEAEPETVGTLKLADADDEAEGTLKLETTAVLEKFEDAELEGTGRLNDPTALDDGTGTENDTEPDGWGKPDAGPDGWGKPDADAVPLPQPWGPRKYS